MTLINTLLGFNAPGGNGAGLITDGGYNLSDDASVPLTAIGSHDNTDLQQGVGSLSDNGGPTLTVPIFPGSPAVDAGNDDACLPTDQRHLARMGRCDIGAFEFNGLEPTTTLSIVRQTAQVLVSWTSAISDYSLQSTPDLTTLNWTPVINSPIVISNRFVVTDSVDGFSRFYRLKSNRAATNQVNSLPTMAP